MIAYNPINENNKLSNTFHKTILPTIRIFFHFIFLQIIFLTTCLPIIAQNNYIVTQYSTQDGLPQKTINTIQQDHKGYMWFGTWNGISRFDGRTFINFNTYPSDSINTTNNRINYLKEHKDGHFWIINNNNYIFRFNPNNGFFQQIPNNNNFKASKLNILSNGDIWAHMKNGFIYRIYSSQKELIRVQKIAHINSTIKSIFVDNNKDIWMYTKNELIQYNIEKNLVSRYVLKSKSTKFNTLRKYYDYFLIGSDNGYLYNFNKEKKRFTIEKLPTNSSICNLKAYSNDKIIINTISDGFFIYNLKNKKSIHYSTKNIDLITDSLKSLYVDPKKNIWLTYNNQRSNISRLNVQNKKLSHYIMRDKDKQPITHCKGINILENINNHLLFHSNGGIINYYDSIEDRLEPFVLSDNPEIISFNEPNSIALDKQKNMWLSKANRGIIKVSFKNNFFNLTVPNKDNIYSTENELHALLEDKNQILWAGSYDGYIQLYHTNGTSLGYLSNTGQISSKKAYLGIIQTIIQDKQGTIWIGTKDKGIIEVTPQSKDSFEIRYHQREENNYYSLSNNHVCAIHEDPTGRIWIGTLKTGLSYIERDNDRHIKFIQIDKNLKYNLFEENKINCIQSAPNGNLWIGTSDGIIQCNYQTSNPAQMEFLTLKYNDKDANGVSCNNIYSIYLTHDNQLYFATYGGGLCKLTSFKNKKASFKTYSKTDGLLSKDLIAMTEDNNGNLWIATEEGLVFFSIKNETFESYDNRFFPSDIQFMTGNAIQTTGNHLVFNTDRGFLSFNPKDIKKNTFRPQIVFNRLFVNGHEIVANKTPLLKRSINETEKITLSHAENSFSINFVALDMKYPHKIQYAYKLDGFDEWNYVGNNTTATYTNIPKGTYRFIVKSTNSDDLWSENEKSVTITISPSFWESIWGILLLILLIIAIILITTYIFVSFYKLKSKVIFEQRLSDVKTKFFTDIVHELRTPFTLIIAPLEHILSTKGLPENIHQDIELVQRNAQRTVKLINQILDFQKIQYNSTKLTVQQVEFYSFTKYIVDSFQSLANSQETEIKLHSNKENIYVWIDADKIENVIFNLLSNAFKYSPRKTQISIDIFEEPESQFITFKISDQGFGITSDKQELIFDRFESFAQSQDIKQASSGIGLSLVKEIIELHKGNIELQSKENEGTTFIVKLPKGKEHFNKDTEFILNDPHSDDKTTDRQRQEEIEETDKTISDQSTLLIVEDNDELRHFLQTILSEDFRVISAPNGKEGLDKTIQYSPDIIISDVVMPIMNGIDMIKEIRSDVSICHIPIVLLTNKSSIESQIEGLQLGIEDYITF